MCMKNKIYISTIIIFSFLLTYFSLGKNMWLGGDSIPNIFMYNFVKSLLFENGTQWGIWGTTSSLSFISWLPHAFFIYLLYIYIPNFADFTYLFLFIFLLILGWYKLFFNICKNDLINLLLAILIPISPFGWIIFNRNVFFILVLFASLPWIILSIKNILEFKYSDSKFRNILPWIYFVMVILFAAPGLMNPGYAIPVILFIVLFIFTFVNWKENWKRFLGIVAIALFFAFPNIIGQINLLLHSQALKDDYWNNVVLTNIPLDRHVKSNTLENVIKGYNWDTLTDYGSLHGEKYYPWWFAQYKDSRISLLLYIPIFLTLFLIPIALRSDSDKKKRYKILIWTSFLVFLIFMIKSSAGPGGQFFYDFMMDHGWFKMFRSPHLKFGVEFMLTICILIALCLSVIKNNIIKYFVIILLSIYIIIFGFYPIITKQYIPPLQKIREIPKEYFDLQKFLQNQNKEKINGENKYNLGILLPPNDSTWNSLNWGENGFYEGYHILHWMNTGTSFLNRNGLSFNSRNLVGFNAWMDLKYHNVDSIDILKSEGYDIFVYDKSEDRKTRFNIEENHEENLKWLDKQDDRLEKIWEEGNLVVYEIKVYKPEDIEK